MDNISKAMDTAIKAPLWFWFAVMIASGIPMLNISNLVQVGIGADFKLGSIPLALVALASASLFAASAFARSWDWMVRTTAPGIERLRFWWKLRLLPKETRALLYVMEDDGLDWLYFEPDHVAVSPARDKGLLSTNLVGDRRDWADLRYTNQYDRTMRRHRGPVRSALRSKPELIDDVRASMRRAENSAKGRGPRGGF